MIANRLPGSTGARRFYLLLGSLVAAAWALLLFLQHSTLSEWLGHEAIQYAGYPLAGRVGVFLLGWFLMLVAMMLPGSLPVLFSHAGSFRKPTRGSHAAGLVVLGYLFPWLLFGALLYLGDSLLHELFEPAAPLTAYAGLIPPAILLTAGLYQFTALKRRSIARCQPAHAGLPPSQVASASAAAVLQGLQLGFFCVGSCWALMLVMFALGHNRLDWMLVLGCIMAVERLAPWGRRLARLVGYALVAWAILWMLAPSPIP